MRIKRLRAVCIIVFLSIPGAPALSQPQPSAAPEDKTLGEPAVTATVTSASPVVQQTVTPPLLTLSEAVELALVHNNRLIDANDSVNQAGLSLRLARSTFHPKLTPNILGSFGQSDASNQTYRLDLSQKLVTGTELRASVATGSDKNQLGTFYSSDTTLAVSQPLLRGFGRTVTRRGLTSAEQRFGAAERERRRAERQVTVDVASAYFRIATQKQLVDTALKALDRARRLLAASEAKLDVGRVSQLDVLRARQLATQAEGQLLDAQGAVEDAMDQLRTLIDYPPDQAFDVNPPIVPSLELTALEVAAQIALSHRPEIKDAREALDEAERAVACERNLLLPQFDLNLAFTRSEVADSFTSSLGFNRFSFATFMAVSMPVDRTPQTIAYNSAVIERDRRKRAIVQIQRQVAEDVRRALRRQIQLTRALAVSRSSLEFAEKEAEVATLRFERGLSNNLDVVNAEEALLAARSRHSALLAEITVWWLNFRQTLGILDPRKDVTALERLSS